MVRGFTIRRIRCSFIAKLANSLQVREGVFLGKCVRLFFFFFGGGGVGLVLGVAIVVVGGESIAVRPQL